MAALSAPEARGDLPAERFLWLRELGSRSVATWAAIESLPEGRTQLVVIERIPRHGALDDVAVAGLVRAGRALIALQHPNVGRTRDVISRSDEVLVVREFIEGVSWANLISAAQPPPLEIALRVLVEVLSGLGALHSLRDDKRQPLGLFHGGLTPDCIFVAPNGSSRLVVPLRPPSTTLRDSHAGQAYLAPEMLLDDDQAGLRADVYSVGVLLWESLTGKRLFADLKPSAIVTQLLSGKVPPATAPPDAPWATPLTLVAARALSVDPQERFPTASAMAMDLRRAAGARLALTTRVGALVTGGFAEVLKARREEFDRARLSFEESPPVAAPNSVSDIPIAIDEPSSDDIGNPSSVPEPAAMPPGARAAPPRPPPPPRIAPPAPQLAALPHPAQASPPVLTSAPAPTSVARHGKIDMPTPIMPIVVPPPAAVGSTPPPAAVGSIPPPDEHDAARTSRRRATRILLLSAPVVVGLAGLAWFAFALRPAAHPEGAADALAAPRAIAATASSPSSAPPVVREPAPETTAVPSATGEANAPSGAPSVNTEATSAPTATTAGAIPNNAKPPARAKRAYDPQGI